MKIGRVLAVVAAIFVATFSAHAQLELGECPGEEFNEKADKQVRKAFAAIKQQNLKMANIYVSNAKKFQPNSTHALYLEGEIGLRERNLRKVERAWSTLLDSCPDYKADLYFFLGIIYLENGKTEKAETLLKTFLTLPNRERGYDRDAKNALKEMTLKTDLLNNPVPFDPKPVRQISTSADEYLAIISPDQELCFFTRRQMKKDKYAGPTGKQKLVEEFTMSTKTSPGNYTKGEPLDYPFNQNVNEGGATITADNKELFFTVCDIDAKGYQNCDIYYCKKENGYWGEVEPLSEIINLPDSWESQPSISPNGDVLYFTSNRPGGHGKLDIWSIQRLPNGEWEAPQNLGPTINTSGNEKSPFLHADSQTLYFASDGHPTLGGFDIFYSKYENSLSDWIEPENIGYPISTEADEIGLFVSLDGKTAFFNSNSMGGPGGWDLYSFGLYEAARPEKVALLKGTLVDKNNEVVKDAELEVKNLKTKKVDKIKVDQNTGEYAAVVQLKEEENIILKVKKEGSAFSSKFVDADGDEAGAVVEADLEVSPIEVGKEYRLNDIRFGSNSFELDENAKQIIDEFVLFLEEQPSVKVDIQGHTDDVGNDGDNLALSRNRAKVVYDYILQKGISSSRLTHHGYGEQRPLESNSTEAGKAQNRRTVFVITAK